MPNGQGEEEEYVQFLPLPEELNRQVLAGLSMLPGQGNASALFKNLQQNSSHSGSPAVAFPGASGGCMRVHFLHSRTLTFEKLNFDRLAMLDHLRAPTRHTTRRFLR